MSAPRAAAARTADAVAAHSAPVTVTEPPAPALRLVRPPDPDPPDAAADRAGLTAGARPRHVQGTLALLFTLPGGLPATPAPTAAVPSTAAPADEPLAQRATLPDPRRWCARLVQATVEAREGVRPTGQLLRWMTRDVHERLCRDAAGRPTAGSAARREVRAVLRSLHVSTPADSAVEACAVIDAGGRSRAVALRLEARGDRWMCTAWDLL